MATVDAKIYVHHYKNDGTWNVKIRVFHKTQVRFLDTEHFVSEKQVKKHPKNKTEYLIKDPFIKKVLNNELEDYRIAISNLVVPFLFCVVFLLVFEKIGARLCISVKVFTSFHSNLSTPKDNFVLSAA